MHGRLAKIQATQVVQRRLGRSVDPLTLYEALSDDGDMPDTGLFEGPDGSAIVMAHAAVRAECRGSAVVLQALSANGRALLRSLEPIASDFVSNRSDNRLELTYPEPETLDAEERLLAPAPLHALRALLEAAGVRGSDEPFGALTFGVVAFDQAAFGEDVPENAEDPTGFPDYIFWVPDSLVLFAQQSPPRLLCIAFAGPEKDSAERNLNDAVSRLKQLVDACQRVQSVERRPVTPVPPPGDVAVDLNDAEYMAVVARMKEEIAAGEVYQIVPSRTFSMRCLAPLTAFAALREFEPAGYHFIVHGPDFTLFGASPETSVRVSEGRTVEVKPIAGTRPRGASEDEDSRLEAEMRLDGKELAEHMMLVDLARNDVARVSEEGTRKVPQLLTVERYSRVMHLVSSVTGKLAKRFDAFDALAACLNVGTLTGAPKLRATQILRATEKTRRGPYGGAIGWINAAGEMDTSVVIRSALVKDGVAYVRAGAGVVHDSDPQAEADETRRKASALLSILAAANRESAQ
jgi:anthranilate synthase component 1